MSDALELIRTWPTWRKASAGRILDSPAWRYRVMCDDVECWLVGVRAEATEDLLQLDLDVEGERHVLSFADSEEFPDLHALWDRRTALPREILLALVEKECGAFLQMLEDVVRRQISLVGLADGEGSRPARSFMLQPADDDGRCVRFSFDLPVSLEMELGRVENLDTGHESIRSLSREAEVDYADFALPEGAALSVGDFLLFPEDAEPHWLTDLPTDDLVRVVADRTCPLTFAEMVDGLPPVPESKSFRVVRAGRPVATAVAACVGSHPAYRIVSLVSPS